VPEDDNKKDMPMPNIKKRKRRQVLNPKYQRLNYEESAPESAKPRISDVETSVETSFPQRLGRRKKDKPIKLENVSFLNVFERLPTTLLTFPDQKLLKGEPKTIIKKKYIYEILKIPL
jgi:hypothetical protein